MLDNEPYTWSLKPIYNPLNLDNNYQHPPVQLSFMFTVTSLMLIFVRMTSIFGAFKHVYRQEEGEDIVKASKNRHHGWTVSNHVVAHYATLYYVLFFLVV
jgi:hypothetical protein